MYHWGGQFRTVHHNDREHILKCNLSEPTYQSSISIWIATWTSRFSASITVPQKTTTGDADRFLLALTQVANRRLTYKELTGKDKGGEGERAPF